MHSLQLLIQVAYIDGRVLPCVLTVSDVPEDTTNKHTQYLDQFLEKYKV
jgi:hypothetical protein